MVAAAHPLTVETALHVLRTGGNAVDAAVAAGLTASVVMPEMCGLGGDLFAVIHAPGRAGERGETVSVQGSGIAPRSASIDVMRRASADGGRTMPYQGPLSISVPGMVDAYFTLLDRYGTRPFAELVEPAKAHASDGFIVQPLGAKTLAGSAAVLLQDPAARTIFLPNGTPIQAGERLVQADLGRTLQTLAQEGAAAFYTGSLAERMTTYLASVGGALTMDDFADHATEMSAPLETTYRGHTVYQTGLPTQGMILLESLNIIEQAHFTDPLAADTIHLQVEAKKLAYADRLGHAADPTFHDTPMERLLSKEWAKQRFDAIDPARAATQVPAGVHEGGDTTYLCVVDRGGMMVSLIQSVSSAFGSCVVGGDTGVVLNNRVGRGFSLVEGHPNIYAPGKKTMHTLNCYLIADPEGRPVLVGGTPGGDGQPQWNMQAISGLIDGGLDVQAAIELPRWTSLPGTDPMSIDAPFELRVESRIPDEVIADLEGRGHIVRRVEPWGAGGAAQIIARDPETGILIGGTDSRVEGMVLGF
jgi:gamma-glutamyltranspeptidase/glutathione hydrolase